MALIKCGGGQTKSNVTIYADGTSGLTSILGEDKLVVITGYTSTTDYPDLTVARTYEGGVQNIKITPSRKIKIQYVNGYSAATTGTVPTEETVNANDTKNITFNTSTNCIILLEFV